MIANACVYLCVFRTVFDCVGMFVRVYVWVCVSVCIYIYAYTLTASCTSILLSARSPCRVQNQLEVDSNRWVWPVWSTNRVNELRAVSGWDAGHVCAEKRNQKCGRGGGKSKSAKNVNGTKLARVEWRGFYVWLLRGKKKKKHRWYIIRFWKRFSLLVYTHTHTHTHEPRVLRSPAALYCWMHTRVYTRIQYTYQTFPAITVFGGPLTLMSRNVRGVASIAVDHFSVRFIDHHASAFQYGMWHIVRSRIDINQTDCG